MSVLFANTKHGHDEGCSLSVEYLSNDKGEIQLEICDTCSELVTVICDCKKNTWYDKDGNVAVELEGVKLICDLCRGDGT